MLPVPNPVDILVPCKLLIPFELLELMLKAVPLEVTVLPASITIPLLELPLIVNIPRSVVTSPPLE